MHKIARRRAVLGGILAGGAAAPLAVAPARAATSTWTPRSVRVKDLRVGDLVTGPDGGVRRVSEVRRLANRQYRVRVTDDHTGRDVPLHDRWDAAGVRSTVAFLVLARDVPVSVVRFPGAGVVDAGDPRTTSLRLFRGTAAQWAQADPVLGAGEPGFEIDTMRLKIGDGGARWSDLPYVAGAGSGGVTTLTHFVGNDLTLARPAHGGPVDWVTTVDGVPREIVKGDWITRVEPEGS